MIRLNVVVEGQTEEAFVHAVLKEPLGSRQIKVAVRCVETSRDKKRHKVYRGGLLDYQKAKRDLVRWMKGDPNPDAYFTTMFDLYALPDDFPEAARAKKEAAPYRKVEILEEAFQADIGHRHFLPYVQLHEFEALILSDPAQFDWEFMEHETAIKNLMALCVQFSSPELIDDGRDTAPSKRIIAEIPEYQWRKTSAGPVIAANPDFSLRGETRRPRGA